MTIKIGGPKGPGSVAGPGSKAPEATKGADRPEASFDRLMAPQTAGADKTAATAAASGASPVNKLVGELATRIRGGELSPEAATRRLVDELVRVRGVGLDAAGQQRLRAHLEQVVASDPMIAARLSRIDRAREG